MKPSELIAFVLLLSCLAYGVHEQSKPQLVQECQRSHYLDSCQYYITKSQLMVIPPPPEYREKYPGFYELIEK